MYHLFYQYNPHGALWDVGNLSWGHSVSGDLVNWAFLSTALDPTSSFDVDGCWSGSTTTLPDGRIAILYTGRDADEVQVQNVAFAKNPSDLLLREWDKPSFNPIIPQPADVTGNNFRDPHHGVARPRRAVEVRHRRRGRRRRLHLNLPKRGLRQLGAERPAAARLAGHPLLGVPRLLSRGGARHGGAGHVGERRRGEARV